MAFESVAAPSFRGTPHDRHLYARLGPTVVDVACLPRGSSEIGRHSPLLPKIRGNCLSGAIEAVVLERFPDLVQHARFAFFDRFFFQIQLSSPWARVYVWLALSLPQVDLGPQGFWLKDAVEVEGFGALVLLAQLSECCGRYPHSGVGVLTW